MRKLASIRRISTIEPIPGADRIVTAHIDGWTVVTQVGWCKPGDLVCFYEVDSFLPIRPEYEFLRKECYKNTENLGEGFRLKSKKLRKQLSQGLIMPLLEVLGGVDHAPMTHVEGLDLTEILGVKLYEKPIPTQLAGRVKGNFPIFIHKTDQERAQNLVQKLQQSYEDGEEFEITMKLDGSSMTVYNHVVRDGAWGPYGQFSFNGKERDVQGVSSRNYDLDENLEADGKKDAFWRCARENNLIEAVKAIKEQDGLNVALQGELMGPGVQGNRENLTTLRFFCFDVFDIDAQRYLLPGERRLLLHKHQVLQVPHILDKKLQELCTTGNVVEDLLKYADRPSMNIDVPAEGLVFKSMSRDFSFKVINNRFLLNEKD